MKLFNLSQRHVQRIVKNAAVKAGIPNAEEVHPHTLRHSYGTHMYNSNVDLLAISRLMGHSDIKVTTIYTHMGMKKSKEIVDDAFGSES